MEPSINVRFYRSKKWRRRWEIRIDLPQYGLTRGLEDKLMDVHDKLGDFFSAEMELSKIAPLLKEIEQHSGLWGGSEEEEDEGE